MAVKLGVDFDPNTKKVEAALARIQAQAKGVQFGGGAKSIDKLSRPLGKITGQASEFQKSLEASNARVLAFGASVAVINKLSQAFGALVSNTIKVEASFAKINTILGGTQQQLEQFGNGIFKVAQRTATSFDQVAEGALELARQGLSVEESLSRVETALKLVRVAGIDSQSAVAGLTAAIKGFEGAGLNVASIADKLAEVDTKFAVSTEDLINGLERASASARVAGVSFDELLGVITTVQERTQRGGAVIGNAFKTIFARLGRTDTLVALEELGIQVLDSQGNVRSAIPLFQELAVELDKLGLKSVEAGEIIQKVAGVRQRDILISLIEDLNSGQSQFSKSLEVSAGAAGALDAKNAQLNDTLEALINNLVTGAQKLSAVMGELGFTDAAKDILSVFSSVVNGITDLLQGDSMGAKFAQGLVKGIGSILTGPGLALISAIFVKLFVDLARFGSTSLKSLLGINKAAEQQNLLQKSVFQTLIQNEAIQREILALEGNKVAQQQLLLKIYNQQAAALARVQKAAATVTPGLFKGGFRGGEGGITRTGRGASGYVAAEARDVSRGVGGAPANSKVVSIPNFAFGGGKRGTMIANTSEYFVPNYAGGGDAIFNRDMIRSSGLPSGARKVNAASGYIPNFSRNIYIRRGTNSEVLREKAAKGDKTAEEALAIRSRRTKKRLNLSASEYSYLVPQFNFSQKGGAPITGSFKKGKKSFPFSLANFSAFGPKIPGGVASAGDPQDEFLEENITNSLVKDSQKYANILTKAVNGRTVSGGNLRSKFSSGGTKGAFGALRSAVGSAFEIATAEALGIDDAAFKKGGGDFDIRNPSAEATRKLRALFGAAGGRSKGEFKVSTSIDNIASFAKKIATEKGMASGGYIPNFARELEEAVEREKAAGIPINQIRINQSGKLRNSQNPDGLAVTNTRDEPTGRIPNFAKKIGSKSGTDGFNSALDGAMGKLFLFQLALGGLTSSFTEQESAMSRFGQAAMSAVNTLIILSTIGASPLGKAGGLGRAFIGGARGASRRGAGLGGQLLAGSKGLAKSFTRIVGIMGKLRAVAGPVALGFTAVDIALKTITGKGLFRTLGEKLGLVSTEAVKAARRFREATKSLPSDVGTGEGAAKKRGQTIAENIESLRQTGIRNFNESEAKRLARGTLGKTEDEELVEGSVRGTEVLRAIGNERLAGTGLSGPEGNLDLLAQRIFREEGDARFGSSESKIGKEGSADLQDLLSTSVFANVDEITAQLSRDGRAITAEAAQGVLDAQFDAVVQTLVDLRDEAVKSGKPDTAVVEQRLQDLRLSLIASVTDFEVEDPLKGLGKGAVTGGTAKKEISELLDEGRFRARGFDFTTGSSAPGEGTMGPNGIFQLPDFTVTGKDGGRTEILQKELELAKTISIERKNALENEIALEKFALKASEEKFEITEEYVKSIEASDTFRKEELDLIKSMVNEGKDLLQIDEALRKLGIDRNVLDQESYQLALAKLKIKERELDQQEQEIINQNKINDLTNPQGFGEGLRRGLGELQNDIAFFGDELGENIPNKFSQNLGTALKDAVTGAKDVGDALSQAGESFLGYIRDAFLQQAADQFTNTLFSGGPTSVFGGSADGSGQKSIFSSIGSLFGGDKSTEAAAGAAAATEEKKGGIGSFFSGLFGGGKKGAALGSSPATPLYVSDVSLSKDGAGGVLEGLTGDKKGEGMSVEGEEGKGFFSGLTDKFGDLFSGLKDGFGEILGGFKQGFSGLFSGGAGGGIGGLFSSIIGGFTGGFGGIGSAIGGFFGFANGGRVGFANGGPVGSTDTVPAMLTPGEFVVKKSAVDKYGTDFLSSLNKGMLPMQGFQSGGTVSPVGPETGSSALGGNQISNNSDFTFNIDQSGQVSQEGGQSSSERQREFAARIRAAVTTTIQEESRTGGSLNYLYKG